MEASRGRIEFLDGLRGVAILFVMAFHSYARWPSLYVYGDRFVGNYLLDTRSAGVRLFFLISGFVILMTLRKCSSFRAFIWRRWLRLFPAMLLCSILIYASSAVFAERPAGPVYAMQLLPGMTFTGGSFEGNTLWNYLATLAGHDLPPVESIEASFWSLYVEAKFYIIFGAMYFLLGERLAITALIGIFIASWAAERFFPGSVASQISLLLHAREYGWFAAGAVFFIFEIKKDRPTFWIAVFLALLSAKLSFGLTSANAAMAALFIVAIASPWLRGWLSNPAFSFLGFVSYPLYLLHENIIVSMIVKLGRAAPEIPAILIPVAPALVVVGVAWLVAKYAEPKVRALISNCARSDSIASEAPSTR